MVSNWNLLTAITKGKITVEPESNRVTYCLSFMELVITGTALVGIFGLVTAWLQNPHASDGYLFIAIIWLWLVGGNYLISLVRFDRFMKRCLKNAGFSARKCRV